MPKIICTLCARGGSKGVTKKNLRVLGGHSLIGLSILQAKKSGLFEAIAVSSDSDEILEEAKRYGAQVLVRRPVEMATDQAPKLPAIRHCFLEAEKTLGVEFDIGVDLDASSPLRTSDDIIGSVNLLAQTGAPNIVTGMPARRSPYFNLVEELKDGTVVLSKETDPPVVRRQDAPRCFDLNASIYVWKREALIHGERVLVSGTRLYEMPEERSFDIDTEFDFEFVRFLISKRPGFPE